jgi:hypothetical protein
MLVCAFLSANIARETAGAASIRRSLRPLFWRAILEQTSDTTGRENGKSRPPVIAGEAKQSITPLAEAWIASLRSQ